MVTEQHVLYGVKRSGWIYCPNKSQTGHLWETGKVRNVEGGKSLTELSEWNISVISYSAKGLHKNDTTQPQDLSECIYMLNDTVITGKNQLQAHDLRSCEISKGIYLWFIDLREVWSKGGVQVLAEKKVFTHYHRDRGSTPSCVAFDLDGCTTEHNCVHGGKPVRDRDLAAVLVTSTGWSAFSWGYTILVWLPCKGDTISTTSPESTVTRAAANRDMSFQSG